MEESWRNCVFLFQVELLHSLVYQTLDYISDKNRKYAASQSALYPAASPAETSLIPHRRNKQTAESQQGDTDGAHSDHDDHVRNAVI